MRTCHFSLAEFAAHRKGQLPARAERALQKHLQSGCPTCTADWDFVERLEEVAGRDHRATPPASVLALAGTVFRKDPSPAPGLPFLVRVTARMTFDSLQQPAPAGVRRGGRLDRRLVYTYRDLLLDVHLEPEQEAGRQSIVGQLQSASGREEDLAELPVMLLEGSRVLRRARTNQDGEFAFSAVPRREMALRLICRDRLVEVPQLPPAGV